MALLVSLYLGTVLILGWWLHQNLWAQGSHFTPDHLTFHRQLDALGVLDHHGSTAPGPHQNTSWHDQQAILEEQVQFGSRRSVAASETVQHSGSLITIRTWDVPMVQISAAAQIGTPTPGLPFSLACPEPIAPPPVTDAGVLLMPNQLPISSVPLSPPVDPPRTLRLGC
ncbi:MAG TPA: hypothetical protein VGW38_09655 [Chloroflexota bacterium]|nr:hypothetical protein [Chloroflexota bacterium]